MPGKSSWAVAPRGILRGKLFAGSCSGGGLFSENCPGFKSLGDNCSGKKFHRG